MNMIIGFAIVLVSVFGGFAMLGGKVDVLWQPWEVLIIAGAAIGSFVIANPTKVILDTGRAVSDALKGSQYKREDYLDLLSLLFAILRQAKSKGMMQLERDIERPYESELFGRFPRVLKHKMSIGFLCDYLRLISLGSEKSHELESLMDQEIETLHKEMSRPLKALQTMAETLPALGIIAAVLGVIKAMGYINQSTEILGGMIGGALVGTFLGILLSYGLVMPIAGIVRARRDERVNYHICIKAGLLAYLNGYAPQICIEYARKVLYSDVQPSFDAVEQATTFNTAARADTAAARAA